MAPRGGAATRHRRRHHDRPAPRSGQPRNFNASCRHRAVWLPRTLSPTTANCSPENHKATSDRIGPSASTCNADSDPMAAAAAAATAAHAAPTSRTQRAARRSHGSRGGASVKGLRQTPQTLAPAVPRAAFCHCRRHPSWTNFCVPVQRHGLISVSSSSPLKHIRHDFGDSSAAAGAIPVGFPTSRRGAAATQCVIGVAAVAQEPRTRCAKFCQGSKKTMLGSTWGRQEVKSCLTAARRSRRAANALCKQNQVSNQSWPPRRVRRPSKGRAASIFDRRPNLLGATSTFNQLSRVRIAVGRRQVVAQPHKCRTRRKHIKTT